MIGPDGQRLVVTAYGETPMDAVARHMRLEVQPASILSDGTHIVCTLRPSEILSGAQADGDGMRVILGAAILTLVSTTAMADDESSSDSEEDPLFEADDSDDGGKFDNDLFAAPPPPPEPAPEDPATEADAVPSADDDGDAADAPEQGSADDGGGEDVSPEASADQSGIPDGDGTDTQETGSDSSSEDTGPEAGDDSSGTAASSVGGEAPMNTVSAHLFNWPERGPVMIGVGYERRMSEKSAIGVELFTSEYVNVEFGAAARFGYAVLGTQTTGLSVSPYVGTAFIQSWVRRRLESGPLVGVDLVGRYTHSSGFTAQALVGGVYITPARHADASLGIRLGYSF